MDVEEFRLLVKEESLEAYKQELKKWVEKEGKQTWLTPDVVYVKDLIKKLEEK